MIDDCAGLVSQGKAVHASGAVDGADRHRLLSMTSQLELPLTPSLLLCTYIKTYSEADHYQQDDLRIRVRHSSLLGWLLVRGTALVCLPQWCDQEDAGSSLYVQYLQGPAVHEHG